MNLNILRVCPLPGNMLSFSFNSLQTASIFLTVQVKATKLELGIC